MLDFYILEIQFKILSQVKYKSIKPTVELSIQSLIYIIKAGSKLDLKS